MLFSSLTFLFLFLPLFFIVYLLVPKKYQNLILFLFSLIFYAWGELKYIWVLLLSTCIDFTVGMQLAKTENTNKRKAFLLVSLSLNLGLLFFFKYSNFICDLFGLDIQLSHGHLPIGISFYTFQTLSYTIDVYRKKVHTMINIIDFGAYVTLFPQLIAGPIVRFADVEKELRERTLSLPLFKHGFERFVIGLSKKVLFANSIGVLWAQISVLNEWSVLEAWLGIIAFGLQIYYDFAGYSDMAIGLGEMLGFHFPENFNNPYYSKTITEFWRRWHMTLGTWFREYVYIPLGGNRVSKPRFAFNLILVWMLTGLWHGASLNFVFWGLYYGILLWIEKVFFLSKKKGSHLLTLFLVAIGWVMFAFEDGTVFLHYLKSMFNYQYLFNENAFYLLSSFGGLIILECLFCHPYFMERLMKQKGITILLLLVFCICYLIDGTYNPFLYFRF